MPKFNEQFFGGLLAGGVLAGLLVMGFCWRQIQVNVAFADQNMKLLFAALNDLETLQSTCGPGDSEGASEFDALMNRYYMSR